MAWRQCDAIGAETRTGLVLIQRTDHPKLAAALEHLERSHRERIRPSVGTSRTGPPTKSISGGNRTPRATGTERIADGIVVKRIRTEIPHVLGKGRGRQGHEEEKDQ